jgi:hypothetical protein
MGLNKAKAPDKTPYKAWDNVKVSKEFFDLLIVHPVFRGEPKAINTSQYWLNALDAAMERNDDDSVTWGYKDIQDRFRPYKQSHKDFRDALRDLGLIVYTRYRPPPNPFVAGECRQFTITALGRKLIADGNLQWLYNLLKDPKTRRRNQVAISKRTRSRIVYSDPIKRIIDEFSHAVMFDRDGVLNQLRRDNVECPGRFGSALHHLLALVKKTFRELELKEGRIYHEFVGLPSEYRPFALFNGKPYVATVDIRACHPTFLGRLLQEYHQQEAAAIAAQLNGGVNQPALEGECNRWTDMFTHPTIDPREAIMNEAGMAIDRRDMKDCLNTWLNGAKKYQRRTDGRWDMNNNKRLEAWFQQRFPEMARVWTAMEHRQITGRIITEEYEGPLMLDPALYALGDELGLTLSYEYDGVGVFSQRDDPELTAKMERVGAFIQRQSVEKFNVPVVVKAELLV